MLTVYGISSLKGELQRTTLFHRLYVLVCSDFPKYYIAFLRITQMFFQCSEIFILVGGKVEYQQRWKHLMILLFHKWGYINFDRILLRVIH